MCVCVCVRTSHLLEVMLAIMRDTCYAHLFTPAITYIDKQTPPLFPLGLPPLQVIMQVDGKGGLAMMKKRIALRGPIAAYDGALAFAGGSLMGHYPW